MRQSRSVRIRRTVALTAAAAASALVLAACATPAAEEPAVDGGAETLQVAFISFAVANTYDEPMQAEIERVAEENNIELTVFDGNLDPSLQATMIQDVVASGQYDGMIVQPVYGPAIYDNVKAAIDAGITVVNIDQILGDDFTSGASQLEGLAANVVFVGSILGQKFGEQAVAACASQNLDPCNVAYLHDLKTSAVSIALWDAFNEVTAGTPVTV
ncbi:MAG: substrate-binding domain-containing protein, partial [Microcella sp.]|nr:substrate-binding domain-containing protein [Microcella sp.]